jgi:pSer/pThr/pTyr-binding forkhead associated (FHA) protein
MPFVTVISRKTPKIRRPVEKRQYFLMTSLKKKPIILSKGRKFTIGRATKNNLPLREGTISERHASIKWEKSSFKIKDEGSTNGTFVNNKRVSGLTILKNGDKIRLGSFVLSYGIKKVREKKQEKPKKKTKKRPARKSTAKKRPAKKRGSKKRTAKRRTAKRRTPRRRTTKRKTTGRRTGHKTARRKVTRVSRKR